MILFWEIFVTSMQNSFVLDITYQEKMCIDISIQFIDVYV